jgi:hypothetical protein
MYATVAFCSSQPFSWSRCNGLARGTATSCCWEDRRHFPTYLQSRPKCTSVGSPSNDHSLHADRRRRRRRQQNQELILLRTLSASSSSRFSSATTGMDNSNNKSEIRNRGPIPKELGALLCTHSCGRRRKRTSEGTLELLSTSSTHTAAGS